MAPGVAIAQLSKAVRRIGVLGPGAPELDTSEWRRSQAEPLEKLGWVEGKNLQVERRYDNGRPEELQRLAEELVRAKVEIIVTSGTPATLAAMHATSTIPIVFRTAGDPVLLGLVASLARPGGNVTGYTEVVSEVTAKQLSMLKELLPSVQRIGVMWDAGNPYIRATRGQFERVCQSLGLVPIIVEISAAGEADGVIAQLVRKLYQRSPRPYHGLDELRYPFHDRTITVTQCGRICFGRRKIDLSTVLAGQNVGVKQVDDKIWLVSFMDYDLGFFDHEIGRLGTAENPFAAKVLPMCPV